MKNIGIKKAYIAILVLLVVQIIPLSNKIAQELSSPEIWYESGLPYIRNYTPKEYGGFIQNWSALQDQRGFVYIANNHGLLEYDGVGWRRYDDDGNLSALLSLAVDDPGIIYVGMNKDFGYIESDSIKGLRFVSLLPKVDEADREFNDVWRTLILNDAVYFVTRDYLFIWSNGEIKVIHPKTRIHTAFVIGQDLYVRQFDLGLTKLTGDSLHMVPGGEIFSDKRIYYMVRRDDSILIGTDDYGFFLYDGQTFNAFPTSADKEFIESKLYCGIQLDGGYHALGTRRSGLIIMDSNGNIVQRINTTNGLMDDSVLFIHADHQGGLWLALNNGIARVETPAAFSVFDKRNGLEGTIEKVYRHNNTLYVATSFGVQYLSVDKNESIPTPMFKAVSGIDEYGWTFLTVDNQLFVGSTLGVYLIEGSKSKKIESPWRSVFSMTKSQQHPDRIYVGHSEGVGILEKRSGQWRVSGGFANFSEKVYGIFEEKPGVLWFETYRNGSARAQFQESDRSINKDIKARIEQFDTSDGLPEGHIYLISLGGEIRFTNSDGMWKFNAQLEEFFPDSAIILPGYWRFRGAEDEQDRLWLSISDDYGEPAQVGFFIPGETGKYQWHQEDFQRLKDIAYVNHIYPEKNGIAWISTSEELIRYTPSLKKNKQAQYNSFIRRVIVNEDSIIYNGTGNLTTSILGYNDNTIHIEFAAPSFDVATENQYQHRIEGLKDEWSNRGYETKKDYTSLSEGEYVFKVRAKNIYGQVSNEAIFSFKIQPPWYRSWWAYTGYIFLFLMSILAAGRIQRSWVIKKEQEKTRIALLEAENKRKTEEMEEARQLQLAMLPKRIPKLPHYEIEAYMKTATEVGGDYYDFMPLDREGKRLAFCLADVSGKGLGGALLMANLQATIRSQSLMTISAKECVENANSLMYQTTDAQKFVTMFYGILDTNNNTMSYCNAGHDHPFLISDNSQPQRLKTGGIPLGFLSDYSYSECTAEFKPGSRLVVYSDGIPEAYNVNLGGFGEEQLQSILTENKSLTSGELIEKILEAIRNHTGTTPQSDDITLLIITRKE